MEAVLESLAVHLEDALKYRLHLQGHRATSALINSVKVVVKEVLTGFEIIGTTIYYGKYVEQGRKPGARGIPLDSLIAWLRDGKSRIQGMSLHSKSFGMQSAGLRSLAFVIQRSIKEKGIEPSNFISDTLSENERYIDEQINIFGNQYVNYYIEEMFNELAA